MRIIHGFSVFLPLALLGCVTLSQYTPPSASALVGAAPYPDAASLCQIIGENALTNAYLDDSALLVGCPTVMSGAITERINEGGQIVTVIGAWTLLSIPQR